MISFKRLQRNRHVIALNYYLSVPKSKKKSLIIQLVEFFQLATYWKTYPSSYFEFSFFLKESNLNITQMKNYILPSKWVKILDRDKDYHILCRDKVLFHDLCAYYSVPTPSIVLKCINGVFYDRKNNVLLPDFAMEYLIANTQADVLFFKPMVSTMGKGIQRFQLFDHREYRDSHESEISTVLTNKRTDSYIIQEGVEQRVDLAKINADSLNTVRIITKNEGSKISIISSLLRVGRRGSIVDNGHAGGLIINIDSETGNLGEFAHRYYDSEKYKCHPDSQVEFKGLTISNWESVLFLVKESAQKFYGIKYIGWDIGLSKDSPTVVEINRRPCMILSQMVSGGLADKL